MIVKSIKTNPLMAYALPFAVFMALTGIASLFPAAKPLLYVLKTIVVGSLLWYWRREYASNWRAGLSPSKWITSLLVGIAVLLIWIAPENLLPQMGTPTGFNPYSLGWSRPLTMGLIATRLIGAALVVPIMEELFWRSFFWRYLINPNFKSVPLGTFNRFSFCGVAILFGLEHHRFIVGIIAGVIYGALLLYHKNLKSCILAHAVTNFGLGVYVLMTQNWNFW